MPGRAYFGKKCFKKQICNKRVTKMAVLEKKTRKMLKLFFEKLVNVTEMKRGLLIMEYKRRKMCG